MMLCDVNIWLALTLSKHIHHRPARTWLSTVDEPASVYFCRATQQAYLRLLTNAAVLAPYGNPPLTNEQAWGAYEELLNDDRFVFRGSEPSELESVWKRFALRGESSPKLWMDAYMAAFAHTADLTMVTTDTAFRQFADLSLVVVS